MKLSGNYSGADVKLLKRKKMIRRKNMGRYLGKRLISTIPLLLVISFVVFMFIHMIPGDPARLVAGQDATKERCGSCT